MLIVNKCKKLAETVNNRIERNTIKYQINTKKKKQNNER